MYMYINKQSCTCIDPPRSHTNIPWKPAQARAPIYTFPKGICVCMCIPKRTHKYMHTHVYICARAHTRPGATHTLTHTHLRARMHTHALTRIGECRTHAGHDASVVYPASPDVYIYIRDTSTHPSRYSHARVSTLYPRGCGCMSRTRPYNGPY